MLFVGHLPLAEGSSVGPRGGTPPVSGRPSAAGCQESRAIEEATVESVTQGTGGQAWSLTVLVKGIHL